MSSSVVPAQPLAATVTVCSQTGSGCAAGQQFSLRTTRAVGVRVNWNNVAPGTHTQTVEFIEPGGGTYHVVSTSFASSAADQGNAQTNALIPVAGSWVTQRSITGKWTLRVSLDGTNVSTQTVELTP